MEKELKFKIYNKLLNKCFKVTRIDYMDEVVYYFDREKNDEDIVSFNDSVLLMPTGIYDCSGREIFEGDVITYQESSFTYKKTAEIIYENGCFMTKQLFPKNLELKAQKENLIIDDFKEHGFDVLNSSAEFIDIADSDDNEYVVKLGGTPKTITINKYI